MLANSFERYSILTLQFTPSTWEMLPVYSYVTFLHSKKEPIYMRTQYPVKLSSVNDNLFSAKFVV